jgi:cytochrome c553
MFGSGHVSWAGAAAFALLLGGCMREPTTTSETAVSGAVHVCTSCHGSYGRSDSPTFPNLAGQQKAYLVVQLKAFRDKSRADPHARTYMFGMAARLDDATIDGLASYFSSQTPAAPTIGDAQSVARGKAIFADGIDASGVPACSACHGANAEGADTVPRLAGQHPEYIINQLQAFQTMARANETMHDNSKNLSAPDSAAVAAFVASQP